MDDPGLAALLASGDPRGLAGVYDAYADRLFAYCTSVLRDRDLAADMVHDTLLMARERVGQLRDPDRLRPWLYAIARNECHRALRDRRRSADLDEAGDVSDESVNLDAGLRAAEARELVWAAAESLNPGEREVLELSVRHGLEGADLADALGVSVNAAHAQASRARSQLERALAVLILARTGRRVCADLDGLLTGWDGRLTPLLRKRLGRHLDRCDVCGEQRRRRVSAATLLAGLPVLAAPPALRERVLRDAGDMRLVAAWEALAAAAGPWRPDGFPVTVAAGRRRFGAAWWSAAAVGIVLLLILGAVVLRSGQAPRTVAGEVTTPGTTSLAAPAPNPEPVSTVDPTTPVPPPTTTTPAPATPLAVVTATPPLVTTVAPTTTTPRTTPPATTTPPRTTTPPPTTPPPPRPTIEPRGSVDMTFCPRQWTANLYAVVTGAVPKAVTATWYVDPPTSSTVPMTLLQGNLWGATAGGLHGGVAITWYVTVTTVDGVVASSKPESLGPCPIG